MLNSTQVKVLVEVEVELGNVDIFDIVAAPVTPKLRKVLRRSKSKNLRDMGS